MFDVSYVQYIVLVNVRHYYECLHYCMCTDPMFDVMQTITEPTTGDDTSSYNTSPTPGSDDGQDHTTKHGHDGLTGHFKKRKPMKPTSRTSINNIVENRLECDAESDRQVNYVCVVFRIATVVG